MNKVQRPKGLLKPKLGTGYRRGGAGGATVKNLVFFFFGYRQTSEAEVASCVENVFFNWTRG